MTVGIAPGTLKALVHDILLDPLERKWTLQGLGMLRTYLTPDHSVRLHVWDSRFATPGASEMHTHPWDMVSTVVAGGLWNNIYEAKGLTTPGVNMPTHLTQRILCGAGGGLVGTPEPVVVTRTNHTWVEAVSSYSQRADQIHVSEPKDGTVTIVERRFGSDVDHADVFWPAGGEWGSAEPRDAARDEVVEIVEYALDEWF